jgi:hypothetical protein
MGLDAMNLAHPVTLPFLAAKSTTPSIKADTDVMLVEGIN